MRFDGQLGSVGGSMWLEFFRKAIARLLDKIHTSPRAMHPIDAAVRIIGTITAAGREMVTVDANLRAFQLISVRIQPMDELP